MFTPEAKAQGEKEATDDIVKQKMRRLEWIF